MSCTPFITLPGGVRLSAVTTSASPTARSQAASLLAQLSAALAPLGAIFAAIDTIQKIVTTLATIKSSLFPPNPGKIVASLRELVSSFDVLITLLPQTSFPILVRDTIDTLILFATGLEEELGALSAQLNAAGDARDKAASIGPGEARDSLNAVADKIESEVGSAIIDLECSAAPVNSLISIINSFSAPIRIPGIPVLGGFGSDIDEALDVVATFKTALESVRRLLIF